MHWFESLNGLHPALARTSNHTSDGRDVLVAGAGADIVKGAAGEDILVAGTTTLATNQLEEVRDEWASERTQTEREANLRDGSGTTERL
ncbi:MAG: hypothetical protein AB8G99_04385, partial [Planctomycetaceae bacterium]